MKSALRDAICRINVMPSGPDAKSVSRGTGFLVAPNLVLTALHVVADRKTDPPTPHAEVIQLEFPGHKSSAVVHQQYWDRKDDWVLLRCEIPPPVPPLPLSTPIEGANDWISFGFPDANPRDGMVLRGEVENLQGTLNDSPVYQLYCRQAAAGAGAPVKGLSGGPVIVGQQVIGIMRFALMDDGKTVAGTLYGCPVALPVARCPSLLSLQPPQPPTKLEVLDAKWRKHRRMLIGAVALLALVAAGLTAKLARDAWKDEVLAIAPFVVAAPDDTAAAEITRTLHRSVADALSPVKLSVLDADLTKQFVSDKGTNFQGLAAQKADRILKGEALRKGAQYHLTLRLYNTSTSSQVWSDKFAHDASQLEALPAVIADKTIDGLNFRATKEERARIITPTTNSSAAFAAYTRGNGFQDAFQMDGPRTILLRFNDLDSMELGLPTDKDWEPVIAAYREAVAADKSYGPAWARLAQTYAMRLDPHGPPTDYRKQAEEALAHAEKLMPNSAEVHIARGHLKYRGDTDYLGALSDYRRAREIEPSNGRLLITIGLTERLVGLRAEAVKTLALAIRRNPENWPMRIVMAESMRLLRRYPEAHEQVDLALKSGSSSVFPYLEHATLLAVETGNIAAANTALRDALEKGKVPVPDLFRALTLSPMLFRILDDGMRPKIDALSLQEANGKFYPLYATSYFLAKADMRIAPSQPLERSVNLMAALMALKVAQEKLPHEIWIHLQLAQVHAAVGQRAEAFAAIERAAKIATKNADAIYQMLVEDFRLTAHMLFGDKAESLKLIEALPQRASSFTGPWLRKDPLFAPLHADPEFIRLTSR